MIKKFLLLVFIHNNPNSIYSSPNTSMMIIENFLTKKECQEAGKEIVASRSLRDARIWTVCINRSE